MTYGYSRVSSEEQSLQLQVDALRAAGCDIIYQEKASGGSRDRPVLHGLLDRVRPGDVLVVWKIDRLSRSLHDLLTIMKRLEASKAGFRSVTESIDTTTPAGRMLLQMIGSVAEFERSVIRERTKAGLAAARAEGRVGGRKHRLTPDQIREARQRRENGQGYNAIAAELGVNHNTVRRALASKEER